MKSFKVATGLILQYVKHTSYLVYAIKGNYEFCFEKRVAIELFCVVYYFLPLKTAMYHQLVQSKIKNKKSLRSSKEDDII